MTSSTIVCLDIRKFRGQEIVDIDFCVILEKKQKSVLGE